MHYTLRYRSTNTDLMLPPNETTWLWQRASGVWELSRHHRSRQEKHQDQLLLDVRLLAGAMHSARGAYYHQREHQALQILAKRAYYCLLSSRMLPKPRKVRKLRKLSTRP